MSVGFGAEEVHIGTALILDAFYFQRDLYLIKLMLNEGVGFKSIGVVFG